MCGKIKETERVRVYVCLCVCERECVCACACRNVYLLPIPCHTLLRHLRFYFPSKVLCVHMCACVCACVWVCEREREKKRERESVNVNLCVCVCVCMCVCEEKRECVHKNVCHVPIIWLTLVRHPCLHFCSKVLCAHICVRVYMCVCVYVCVRESVCECIRICVSCPFFGIISSPSLLAISR